MKLSPKQKEVIQIMREGHVIRWQDGLNPSCFLSNLHTFKLSTATCLRLEELSLVKREQNKGQGHKFILTELGKTISL